MSKVLLVEDDRFFAQEIRERLVDCSAEVVIVESAATALQAPVDQFVAVVIDVMVPNDASASGISAEESRGGFLTGVAVARRFLQKRPGLPILLFSGGVANFEAEKWAEENKVAFAYKADGLHAVLNFLQRIGAFGAPLPPKAFIVHGHDEQALLDLKNYIQNVLKWQEPTVLREQASGGRTIIEKFEELSEKIDFVFVLMTPDDKVLGSSAGNDEKRRSRQNVIFELGFFYGKLKRRSARVVILHKGGCEIPSDIQGIIWIDISNGILAAGEEIRREIASNL